MQAFPAELLPDGTLPPIPFTMSSKLSSVDPDKAAMAHDWADAVRIQWHCRLVASYLCISVPATRLDTALLEALKSRPVTPFWALGEGSRNKTSSDLDHIYRI